MVKKWGMSEKAGLRTHDTEQQTYFVINDVGPQTVSILDAEIQRILQVSNVYFGCLY